MKIRIGFISNSSSSSFIASIEDYPFAVDLAREMIEQRNFEPQEDKDLAERLDTTLFNNGLRDKQFPVTFDSTNYNTWIYPDEKLKIYLVSTCNNINWRVRGFLGFDISRFDIKYIKNLEDLEYFIDHIKKYFYKIEIDAFVRSPGICRLPFKNRECYGDQYIIKNMGREPICLSCSKKKITTETEIYRSKLPKCRNSSFYQLLEKI